ncbi:MAG: sodium ion-translocating decarboxylase subunit beta [Deltaproteobacteria bacterium]|nr:sodium ion-translocating decarboxylase subunit beta [Deltaproteobacteria bacterium]MCB9478506.1 sodium ion-translocating decarboxylase subunit beta [Deltaproteobacteria bacterium]
MNLTWGNGVLIVVACVLIYLGVRHKFEPLLLVPIGFGIIMGNIPGGSSNLTQDLTGLPVSEWTPMDFIYQGVRLDIYPPLIFLGLGAMTDFSFLLSRPKMILLGAAAQVGIFLTLLLTLAVGFKQTVAASIAIIGGADGPTAIYITSKLAPEYLAPIAVAAYSYMALVPIIQPPIIRLLTTKHERSIRMGDGRDISKTERIVFPIATFIITGMFVPKAGILLGMFFFGNLLRESGVTNRLSDTAQHSFINILTILLGLSVGASARADTFLTLKSLGIFVIGVFAFTSATAAGVLFAKVMNLLPGQKINPLIGAAGVSAVPMAARVANQMALEEDKTNFLLMDAMGPNVAGVIGSAVAAGVLLAFLG